MKVEEISRAAQNWCNGNFGREMNNLYNAGYEGYVHGYIAGQSQWISVNEALPEFENEILCYYAPIHPIMSGYKKGILKRYDVNKIPITGTLRRNFDENGFGMASKVTHWQPLPENPIVKDSIKQ